MANLNQFTVPVGTRHSIGIELEFLVAWLPTKKEDPHKSEAKSLPPLLRIDSRGFNATVKILDEIRQTLEKNGIPVVYPTDHPTREEEESTPRRLLGKDKWDVGLDSSVDEFVYRDYKWQGIEVRSPALWATEESFEQIQYVVNVLTSSYRLRVNPTCGFHVHVGNGRKYLTPNTIKRLGGFLWAADPMLSRLHPPWRRVSDYCTSIRYQTVLAYFGTTAEKVRNRHKEFPPDSETLPLTDFSDVTLERNEYGGKKGWTEFARLRNEVGPFMTLFNEVDDSRGTGKDNDDNDDGGDNGSGSGGDSDSGNNNDNDNNNGNGNETNDDNDDEEAEEDTHFDISLEDLISEYNRPQSEASTVNLWLDDKDRLFESPGSMPTPHLPDAKEVEAELARLFEEYTKAKVPPDPHTLYRNFALLHWDELPDPEVGKLLHKYHQREYKNERMEDLSIKEQIYLLILAQCRIIFGHSNAKKLSEEEKHVIILACGPYLQTTRTAFKWNATAEKWEVHWQQCGLILNQPKPKRVTKVRGKSLPSELQKLAQLTDLDSDSGAHGIEYVSRSEHDKAFATNKGIEELFKDLRDYAYSPDLPTFKSPVKTNKKPSVEGNEQTSSDEPLTSKTPRRDPNELFLFKDDELRPEDSVSQQGKVDTDNDNDNDDDDEESSEAVGSPSPPPSGIGLEDDAIKTQLNDELFFFKDGESAPNDSSSSSSNGSEGLTPPSSRQSGENKATGADKSGSDHSSQLSSSSSPFSPEPRDSAAIGNNEEEEAASDVLSDMSSIDFHNDSASTSSDDSFLRPSSSIPILQPDHPPPTKGKLRPHDVDDLSDGYKAYVQEHAGLIDDYWERVTWLPSSTYPTLDPLIKATDKSVLPLPPPARPEATTVAGLAEIMACESAAEVAELLSADMRRPNYNFLPYTIESLNGVSEVSGKSESTRTVEFREAAGTLDAGWIVTYARICEGIVRWCRCIDGAEYLAVLAKLLEQEERDTRWKMAKAKGATTYEGEEQDEANRYDVCDLLEDMGLFVEAAWVRKRERERGPPR